MIKNAHITSVRLAIEDHGILTCWVNLDYGGSGQGFGGYVLDAPRKIDGKHQGRFGTAYGMEFIRRILTTVGAKSWESLPGMSCRVDAEHSKIHAIGHFIEDRWFRPEELKGYTEPKECL